MRLLPCGDTALLLECDTLDEVAAWSEQLTAAGLGQLEEIVPAARTVLLRVRPGSVTQVRREVQALDPAAAAPPLLDDPPPVPAPETAIPVIYDGPDLYEVGELTRLGARGVVEAHTSQLWRVAFCGFLPGFGYLVGDDDRLHVPRRADPRTRVPAGAVGLAGEFTGAYPRSSPGGWQLIGRTDAPLWDVERDPPALLRPGVRVHFVAVS